MQNDKQKQLNKREFIKWYLGEIDSWCTRDTVPEWTEDACLEAAPVSEKQVREVFKDLDDKFDRAVYRDSDDSFVVFDEDGVIARYLQSLVDSMGDTD